MGMEKVLKSQENKNLALARKTRVKRIKSSSEVWARQKWLGHALTLLSWWFND